MPLAGAKLSENMANPIASRAACWTKPSWRRGRPSHTPASVIAQRMTLAGAGPPRVGDDIFESSALQLLEGVLGG